jgi:hypothetical protein
VYSAIELVWQWYLFWKEAELAVDLGPDPVGCGSGIARELLLVLQQVDEVAGLAGLQRVQRAELIQKSEKQKSTYKIQPDASSMHFKSLLLMSSV